MSGQRGIALLEVIVTGALLAFSLVAGLSGFSYLSKQQRRAEAVTAINPIEDAIRKEVMRKIRAFYQVSAPNCQPYEFNLTMTADLPNGVRIDPMTAGNAPDDAKIGPHARIAKQRCLTRQYTMTMPLTFSSASGIYFCLTLRPGAGEAGAASGLATMEPVFGEFYYTPYSPMAGTGFSCNAMSPLPRRMLHLMTYAFYWTGGEGVYRHFESFLAMANL